MRRVIESSKISPQTASGIGIAIHKGGLHIGLLYRVTDSATVRLLHLATHHRLRSDDVKEEYVCWVRPSIGEDRSMAIAALCRRIWKQNVHGRVPYGLSLPTQFFDTSGQQLVGPAKIGLTCASFVLAVFDAAGLPLVDYVSWPAPSAEDIARQQQLLANIATQFPDEKAHVDAAVDEVGNTRFAPLDVAGAGTADSFPADYAYSSKIGAAIRELLTNLLAPPPPTSVDEAFGSEGRREEG